MAHSVCADTATAPVRVGVNESWWSRWRRSSAWGQGPRCVQWRLPAAVSVRRLHTGRLEHRHWPSDDHDERTTGYFISNLVNEQSGKLRKKCNEYNVGKVNDYMGVKLVLTW